MSNMSYVRHENTLRDLEQVIEEWDDFYEDESSGSEIRARKRFPQVIKNFYWDLVDAGLLIKVSINMPNRILAFGGKIGNDVIRINKIEYKFIQLSICAAITCRV